MSIQQIKLLNQYYYRISPQRRINIQLKSGLKHVGNTSEKKIDKLV
jgi:hypothetical protein